MKTNITVSQIAKGFPELTIYTFRRNAKLLLGTLEQSMGKPRKMSQIEAFKLWIGSALISAGMFTVEETKKILDGLIAWVEHENLLNSDFSKKVLVKIERLDKGVIRLKYVKTGRLDDKIISLSNKWNRRDICKNVCELEFPRLVKEFKKAL